MVDPFAGHRKADQSATVLRHEVNRIRRRHLPGDNQIALVFAVFIVDHDNHFAIPDIFDDIRNRRQKFCEVFLGGSCNSLFANDRKFIIRH